MPIARSPVFASRARTDRATHRFHHAQCRYRRARPAPQYRRVCPTPPPYLLRGESRYAGLLQPDEHRRRHGRYNPPHNPTPHPLPPQPIPPLTPPTNLTFPSHLTIPKKKRVQLIPNLSIYRTRQAHVNPFPRATPPAAIIEAATFHLPVVTTILTQSLDNLNNPRH